MYADDLWNYQNDEMLGFNVPYGVMSRDDEWRAEQQMMLAEQREEAEIWRATYHFPKKWDYSKYPIVKLDMDTNQNNPDYVWF